MAVKQFIPFVPTSPNFKDIAGRRFGRLVAREPLRNPARPHYGAYWRCDCDCGESEIVNANHLLKGATQSCGCLQRERTSSANFVHGLCDTPTRDCWQNMLRRCNDPTHDHYKYYGGRGISHDPRWSSFINFVADMGEAPAGMQIDRRDNNGHYTKENCRWVTRTENTNNRRNTIRLTVDGEPVLLVELARRTGISYSTLYSRVKRGYPVERVIANEDVRKFNGGSPVITSRSGLWRR